MIRKRRRMRLKGFNYASSGAYFVTICAHGRMPIFGKACNGTMECNVAGRMVESWWNEMGRKFPSVAPDTFVVMPNHVHGIVLINNDHVGADFVGADVCVGPCERVIQTTNGGVHAAKGGGHVGPPLQRVIQWFKTMTTNAYLRGVKNDEWPGIPGHLWQRGYYEHIVRNAASLERIRQYITDNPGRWDIDVENVLANIDAVTV